MQIAKLLEIEANKNGRFNQYFGLTVETKANQQVCFRSTVSAVYVSNLQ